MNIKSTPDYGAIYNKRLLDLKNQRKILLEKLDIIFLISLEKNDDNLKNKVIEIKNNIRDFPLEMENQNFSSFDELLSWIPSSFNINI